MSEELKNALEQFVQSALSTVQTVTAEQLPLVLQDIVGAQHLQATLLIVVGIPFLLLGTLFLYWEYTNTNRCNVGDFGIPGTLVIFLGLGLIVFNIYSYLYASWFPRLVIIDYLRNLI